MRTSSILPLNLTPPAYDPGRPIAIFLGDWAVCPQAPPGALSIPFTYTCRSVPSYDATAWYHTLAEMTVVFVVFVQLPALISATILFPGSTSVPTLIEESQLVG